MIRREENPDDNADVYLIELGDGRECGAQRRKAAFHAERDERLICLPCKAVDTLWTFETFPEKRVYSLEVLSVTSVNGEV